MAIAAATNAQITAVRDLTIQAEALVQLFHQGSINQETAPAAFLTEVDAVLDDLKAAVDAVVAAV